MRFILLAAGILFGFYTYSQKYATTPLQIEELHSDVIMYSLTTCGYCRTLRAELEEQGVDFTEVFIDKNRQARDDLTMKLQQAGFKAGRIGTPTLDVKGHMLVNNPPLSKILKHIDL